MKRLPLVGLACLPLICAATGAKLAPLSASARPAAVQIPRSALFGNPERTAATISPDGRTVAFLAPRNGVLNIWVAPVGAMGEARALTNEAKPIGQFFWAPDSRRMLYLRDRGGDENFRLYGVPLSGGPARDYTPFEKTQAAVVRVSARVPGAVLIALNRRDRSVHDLYRLNLESGELIEVWRNPGGYEQFAADGALRPVLAQKSLDDGGGQIDRINADGSATTLLRFGLDDAATSIVGVDDRGHGYFLNSVGRDKSVLSSVDFVTGRLTTLGSAADADVRAVIQAPDGRPEAFSAEYRKPKWTALDARTGRDIAAISRIAGAKWTVDSQSGNGEIWTVWVDRVRQAPAFYLYDRRFRLLSKLFDVRPALSGMPLAPMHALVIKARDGLALTAYLTLPVESDRDEDGVPDFPVPLVLSVHGGPWSRDVYGYSGTHQWLANRGYAVLAVNFRGSTGLGKAFLAAGNRQWGARMQADLSDAMDYAVARRITTPDRVAIMGTSYGGYATLMGLAREPGRYRCGVDIVGPSNLITLMKTIPPYWGAFYRQFVQRVGDPATPAGEAMLRERSPLTYASAISAPLLIGQGANDPRVARSESDQIARSLTRRGLPVTYVLYPDEGHGFQQAANRLSFNAITELFLSRCLGGTSQPVGGDMAASSAQLLSDGGLAIR